MSAIVEPKLAPKLVHAPAAPALLKASPAVVTPAPTLAPARLVVDSGAGVLPVRGPLVTVPPSAGGQAKGVSDDPPPTPLRVAKPKLHQAPFGGNCGPNCNDGICGLVDPADDAGSPPYRTYGTAGSPSVPVRPGTANKTPDVDRPRSVRNRAASIGLAAGTLTPSPRDEKAFKSI